MKFNDIKITIEEVHQLDDTYVVALKELADKSMTAEQKKTILPIFLASIKKIKTSLWHLNTEFTLQQNAITAIDNLLEKLLCDNLEYREHELINFCRFLKPWSSNMQAHNDNDNLAIRFPMVKFLEQFEHTYQRYGMSQDAIKYIKDELGKSSMLNEKSMHTFYKVGTDIELVSAKFDSLVKLIEPKNRALDKKFYFPDADIGSDLNRIIESLDSIEEYQKVFFQINALKASKPSKTFFKQVNAVIMEIGEEAYVNTVHEMLSAAADYPTYDYWHYISQFDYEFTKHDYLSSETRHFIKGLVWTLKDCATDKTVPILARLLEKSYSKIPDIGPACKLIGNAVILVLADADGVNGLGALSRIKLKLKHPSSKKLIDKQLEAGAKRLGVSVENLGEMAVPDFGFE